MLALFTSFFSAFGELPVVVSIVNSMIAAWTAYQKAKEGAAIDAAVKDTSSPKMTSDQVKKAAEDAANATRNL